MQNSFETIAMITPHLEDGIITLRPGDDVAIARQQLNAGHCFSSADGPATLSQSIPAGHKIALRSISDGEPVRKYGQIIGFACGTIRPGDHVHTHNLVVRDFPRRSQRCNTSSTQPPLSESTRTFPGYECPDGRVGTRNYLAVVSSVNCSASVARHVKERFPDDILRRDYPHVDGVIAFTHKGGCGLQPGSPHQLLMRVLAGIVRHPNVAGCVMIGLGCEVNQLDQLRREHRLDPNPAAPNAPTFLNIQSMGGTRKTVEAAAAAVQRLLHTAETRRRTPQPVSRLVLAEQCGGSDAYSGITANPALGVASDELVRHGGTSVLAETPEIYGAEHLLLERAISSEVAEQLTRRIRWWEDHVRLHGASIDNNPAPGNKAGGLTTIFEKSLGAIAKGGQAPLTAVYEYAEPIRASGFCFMDTPGYDPVSMTGLVSGGCNIGVFTTGRGSVYGCKPTPCIKVAASTPLYQHLEDDMDFNAGTILDGVESIQQAGLRLFELIIAVAGGQRTRSELNGFGDEEFAPWQLGPTF
jgi:altronate dehydratase